ncbi:unnamed protein product, partial [Rotaria sordida]
MASNNPEDPVKTSESNGSLMNSQL